jgi:hypothetical protein
MQETDVCLQFACGHCQGPITARLHCAGQGVASGPHTAAGVKICCPHCQCVSKVYFELSGMVLAVERERSKPVLEPSLN